MVYFLAGVAAIAGFLFGYDEGVIAVAEPLPLRVRGSSSTGSRRKLVGPAGFEPAT